MDEYREANRALWNAWTRINLRSELYDVEAFAARRLGFVAEPDGAVHPLPGPSWRHLKAVARRLIGP